MKAASAHKSFNVSMRAEYITELEHVLLTNILMDVECDYAFMHLPVFYSGIFAILSRVSCSERKYLSV